MSAKSRNLNETDGQAAILSAAAPFTGNPAGEAPSTLPLTPRTQTARGEPEPHERADSDASAAEPAGGQDHPPPGAHESAAEQTPPPQQTRPPSRRHREPLPDVDELQQRMLRLVPGVLTGSISVQKATFVQRTLGTLLNVQQKQASSGPAGADSEVFLEVVRHDPALVNVLQDYLTDEQLEQILREAAQE